MNTILDSGQIESSKLTCVNIDVLISPICTHVLYYVYCSEIITGLISIPYI